MRVNDKLVRVSVSQSGEDKVPWTNDAIDWSRSV